jgi:AcrR family transcriptional regulator
MSGNSHLPEAPLDPRARRTSDALRQTLRKLVSERRYDQIRIVDVVRGSGVGRSTFYEHYKGIDDMIVETLGDMLEALSTVVDEQPELAHITHILEHFRENRTFARHLFTAPEAAQVARRIIDDLAARMTRRLHQRAANLASPPALAPRLAARYIATGQMDLIRSALANETFDSIQLARALSATGRAAADALLHPHL